MGKVIYSKRREEERGEEESGREEEGVRVRWSSVARGNVPDWEDLAPRLTSSRSVSDPSR